MTTCMGVPSEYLGGLSKNINLSLSSVTEAARLICAVELTCLEGGGTDTDRCMILCLNTELVLERIRSNTIAEAIVY